MNITQITRLEDIELTTKWYYQYFGHNPQDNKNTPLDFDLDLDLEELEAHVEMYNEHCIRVIGSALRNRPDYLDTQSYIRF